MRGREIELVVEADEESAARRVAEMLVTAARAGGPQAHFPAARHTRDSRRYEIMSGRAGPEQ